VDSTRALPAVLEGEPAVFSAGPDRDESGIFLTDDAFVLPGRRYAFAELDNLRSVRGAYHPLVRASLGLAGLVLFAVAVSWRMLDAAGWLGAAVLVAVPLAAGAVVLRLRPRRYQLWADHRGRPQRLLSTPDPSACDRVRRALAEAMRRASTG
jgi:uncharacterized protein DUF6232